MAMSARTSPLLKLGNDSRGASACERQVHVRAHGTRVCVRSCGYSVRVKHRERCNELVQGSSSRPLRIGPSPELGSEHSLYHLFTFWLCERRQAVRTLSSWRAAVPSPHRQAPHGRHHGPQPTAYHLGKRLGVPAVVQPSARAAARASDAGPADQHRGHPAQQNTCVPHSMPQFEQSYVVVGPLRAVHWHPRGAGVQRSLRCSASYASPRACLSHSCNRHMQSDS